MFKTRYATGTQWTDRGPWAFYYNVTIQTHLYIILRKLNTHRHVTNVITDKTVGKL